MITDFGAGEPAIALITSPNGNPKTNPENLPTKGKATSKPANEVIIDSEVITDPSPSQRDQVSAFPLESGASPQTSPRASAWAVYGEAIELGLSRGRNAMAIWQDLIDQYGFASSYQSVQRFVRKLRGRQTREARVVITTAPGQEAQVDYGTGPMVRDPESRKYRRTRLFVMTLGCSRTAVRLLVFRSSARIWAELHGRAFRRLGGATLAVESRNEALRTTYFSGRPDPSIWQGYQMDRPQSGITHGNHPRSNRLARIFQCLAVPRQPLKLLETLENKSSEKAGVGGSTPSLATKTSHLQVYRSLLI